MPAGVTGVTLEYLLRVVIASAVDAAVVVLLIIGADREERTGHDRLKLNRKLHPGVIINAFCRTTFRPHARAAPATLAPREPRL